MSASNPDAAHPFLREPPDFSLVVGGPLYQIFRRARLEGATPDELMRPRILVLTAIAWVPLLLLSLVEGNLWPGSVKLPFFNDISTQVRFLLALPLLVMAEMIVHQRMRPLVAQFLARRLISDEQMPRFEAAIAAAVRLRNSVLAEVLMIAFVYGVGVLVIWRTQVAIDVTSWYGTGTAGQLRPSLAGWWFGLVSLPLFQFLLLRWYFRLVVWARFLWQVSRIDLQIVPTHPDRCGGMGFLTSISIAFAPVLFAQGLMLAGPIADRIFHAGGKLMDFKLELIALVAFMVLAVLGPLLVFAPRLAAAKRTGLREYGILAQSYVREFDQKWLRGGAPADESLVGSADIQSLADLGESYKVVTEMRASPFTLRTVLQLGVITLMPVAPLLLTVIPLEQLVDSLLKMVF